MENKYWVKYRYENVNRSESYEPKWYQISEFVTTGEHCEYKDLEAWWKCESSGSCEHELLEVVKL